MVPSDPLLPRDAADDGAWPGPIECPPPPPAGLMDRLERATSRRVRRRTWRRRSALALGLAAAWAIGAATSPWARIGRPAAPAAGGRPVDVARGATPSRPARVDPVTLARELRERGDRLLAEDGDVEGALACYREHLELASLQGRPVPDADDSWLLSAMKNEVRPTGASRRSAR